MRNRLSLELRADNPRAIALYEKRRLRALV